MGILELFNASTIEKGVKYLLSLTTQYVSHTSIRIEEVAHMDYLLGLAALTHKAPKNMMKRREARKTMVSDWAADLVSSSNKSEASTRTGGRQRS